MPLPPDVFSLDELETFRTLEGAELAAVNYFIWLHDTAPDEEPRRFLYCLEIIFSNGKSLLLSSGEDSTAIRSETAEGLFRTASQLQKLHGKPSIQHVGASDFPLWAPLLGHTLAGIRLSRNAENLYSNDALLLDFGEQQILVRLAETEGLLLGSF